MAGETAVQQNQICFDNLEITLNSRLGDLGAIDKKYDVAVSTACTSLNTVLVDTAETGKACIEYLRR